MIVSVFVSVSSRGGRTGSYTEANLSNNLLTICLILHTSAEMGSELASDFN